VLGHKSHDEQTPGIYFELEKIKMEIKNQNPINQQFWLRL